MVPGLVIATLIVPRVSEPLLPAFTGCDAQVSGPFGGNGSS